MPMGTGSPRKLNGNTRAEPERRRRISSGMITRNWGITAGSIRTQAGIPGPLGRSNPMPADFLIFAATSGNGATIFTGWIITVNLLQRTPKDQTLVKRKWFEAGRGGSARSGAGQVIATTRILGMPMSVSAMTFTVFVVSGRPPERTRSEERRVGKEGRSRWSPD